MSSTQVQTEAEAILERFSVINLPQTMDSAQYNYNTVTQLFPQTFTLSLNVVKSF
jgi:hypothetical protein